MSISDGSDAPESTYVEKALLQQRAIAALLPARQIATEHLPIGSIAPNPFQARARFSHVHVLADTITIQGPVCILHVRPDPNRLGRFQLLFGEEWLRATEMAGLSVIHCAIAPYSDEELLEIGLLENIMQGDLDPLEEAFALRTLVEQRSYTPHQLAERIGKDVAYVTQRLQMVGIVVEERADTTASAPDSARSNRPVPDTSEITRHVIRGDIQTLRTIFARWNEVLRHGGDERAIILGYLEELVAEARRLERWR